MVHFKVTATKPKISQLNVAQNITLPPLLLSVVDRGQHGTGLPLCGPIRNKLQCTGYSDTSMKFVKSIGLAHTSQPSPPHEINEPWPPMSLSLVHYCSPLSLPVNIAHPQIDEEIICVSKKLEYSCPFSYLCK